MSATIRRMLFTTARHEPLRDPHFSEEAARESIARIAARAQLEQDAADGLWPRDPADAMRPGEGRAGSVYWGAAGIIWALNELARKGYLDSAPIRRELVERLEARLRDNPDDPDFGVDGVWFGVPGVLAVAEHCWPDASRRDRLAELAAASLASPALEPMMGHPGHMVLAAQLHARTREARWAELWSAGAERLFAEWRYDAVLGVWAWTQRIEREPTRYFGAAHGLVGNAHALLRGGALLPTDRRKEVERRVIETVSRAAVVEDARANWPPEVGGSLIANDRIRVQWCHGAVGVLTALWDTAPDDDDWSDLLLAAGRLVWDAGPIRDSAGLCHGTAGNAYALLSLWRRTGDERWLERARAFAAHAAGQVDERATRLGHGRHSLFTGDEGVALCLAACVAGDERLPVADWLI